MAKFEDKRGKPISPLDCDFVFECNPIRERVALSRVTKSDSPHNKKGFVTNTK